MTNPEPFVEATSEISYRCNKRHSGLTTGFPVFLRSKMLSEKSKYREVILYTANLICPNLP